MITVHMTDTYVHQLCRKTRPVLAQIRRNGYRYVGMGGGRGGGKKKESLLHCLQFFLLNPITTRETLYLNVTTSTVILSLLPNR